MIHERNSQKEEQSEEKRIDETFVSTCYVSNDDRNDDSFQCICSGYRVSDGGQEAIEVQADEEDNAEISIQDEDTDNAEDLMGEALTLEDAEDASVDTDVFEAGGEADSFSADSGDIAAFADESTGTDEAKVAAAEYLKTNYIDNNNKVITNGGTSVVKSDDGLSYSVGLKTPSGFSLSSIRFKTESSRSSYKSGWYISSDCQWVNVGTRKPSNLVNPGVNRPTADQGAQALRLF
ncbi:hypothetical protein DW073_03860 [Ruminococcus sp. AF45-4BH]|nr:hypothetical protein DW073_03860 [Ruminococcus sp. AF45-4BH]